MYRRNRKGFSLVELLAVVLILGVLAAAAIPLYTAQRRSAAARTCRGNIATMASACSAFALRQGVYPAALANLVGATEGLTEVPFCPLAGNAYTYQVNVGGDADIICPDAATHAAHTGRAQTEWERNLPAPAADALP